MRNLLEVYMDHWRALRTSKRDASAKGSREKEAQLWESGRGDVPKDGKGVRLQNEGVIVCGR